MKTKRIFSLLNFVALLLTIISVSVIFMRKLNTGKDIYNQVYSFSKSVEANNLNASMYNCATLTEEAIGSILTPSQVNFLYDLNTTLDKMEANERYLSTKFLYDNAKTLTLNTISNNYKNLEEKRRELIHKYMIYKIKMSGNIYGDPEGTYSIIISDTLDYLKSYAENLELINNYVYSSIKMCNETMHNLITVHNKLIINTCNNFNYLTFEKSTMESLTKFNAKYRFDKDNNIIPSATAIGGLYSVEAYNFNLNFSRCNKDDFALYFNSMDESTINPITEKDNSKLAYYYLANLIKEGV